MRLGLSLVLSLALWLYITGKENPNIVDYNQPLIVTASSVGTGLTVSNSIPQVRMRIRVDNGNQIITPGNFHTFVDLFKRGPGSYRSVAVQVVTDPGIHVVEIIPPTVPVVIENERTKSVPVLPHLLGSVSVGYEILRPRVDPSTVRVTGPESLLSQVTAASVDVNVSQVRTSVIGSQKPLLIDSQGVNVAGSNRLLVNPQEINYNVPVRQQASYKTLPLLVSVRGQPKAGFGVSGITVTPAEITAKGPPEVLSRLTTASTSAVWVSRRGAGQFTVKTHVRVPKGVSTDTKTVVVQVKLAPVDASSSIEVGIAPQNVPSGLAAHTTPAYVLVTVVGPSSRLGSAGRSMRANIDLTGYSAGTFSLAPTVVAPRGLNVSGVYPPRVTVSLQPAPTR